MDIKTMAIKIDTRTYPVAVACLPPTFATIPYGKVDGCYLIINVLHPGKVKGRGQLSVLINIWMDEALFNETYEIVEVMPADSFALCRKRMTVV